MLGVVFLYHGSQKLFGWFGGPGLDAATGMFEKLNLPYPAASVIAASGAEFVGGILLVLGLFFRPAALVLMFTMGVASFHVHWPRFSNSERGMEYPLTLAVASLALALIGPGRIALGRMIWRR